MMTLRIDERLKELNKNRNWLHKQTNISYANIVNIANNNTSSIKWDVLERICVALECNPGDIVIMKQ